MNQIQRKNKVVDEFELETPAVAAPSNSHPSHAGPVNSDIEVKRLAGLSPIEYERQREEVAKRLGVRLQTLDRLVQQARAQAGANPEDLLLPEIASSPWPEQVAGAVLLDEMTAGIRQHVTLEKGAAEATALWTVHTHALDASATSPRLAITSPVMKCGKTTLLDVVACLVRRPMTTVNTTPAAMYRLVDRKAPTLLIDEADTFLTKNAPLRGILNSGYRKNSAFVMRADEIFSTWAAVAIAMIGRLPSTLEDRSILVRLQRRRADEPNTSFRQDQTDDLKRLGRMAARSRPIISIASRTPIPPCRGHWKTARPTTGGLSWPSLMLPAGNGQRSRGRSPKISR
jgi:hypothetical protein